MKKKSLSIFFALLMVLCMSVVAMAGTTTINVNVNPIEIYNTQAFHRYIM
ncbi:hypothetical protein [Serpentinicella alkaliphila]|uniref:Uncharacterized protein n=1 Tax=Serpentinicella alkaliphila TaxID=1734049 RepID=A0A4R2TVS8_9FIRM|nr:hypothetical protein [Serpentinicella alkaliphila]QUH25250.1 hypothetical protein HZR23_05380 [Serpentinicella alkaliphila]TCQ07062.1 hypothetical protein EDD79_100258 [Serpentinicella alkaliphila]